MVKSYDDNFFKGDPDVLAVYDFDYDASFDFNYKLQTRTTLFTVSVIPYCWPCLPCCAAFVFMPMFSENVRDAVDAQHVAITRDGIKYVVERHKSGCRMDCQDVGKVSKTVPFDKITDCDVEEPAGSSGPCCCLVENVLFTVNVDTASGNGGGHELVLAGLKDPHQFKKDVWSMKRGEGVDASPFSTGSVEAPSALVMDDRYVEKAAYVSKTTGKPHMEGAMMSPDNQNRLLALIEEQNKILRNQTKVLKDILQK